jgi:hypothetical protein
VRHTQNDTRVRLAQHFLQLGHPVFFTRGLLPARAEATLRLRTPPELAQLGFIRIDAGNARPSSG